MTEHHPSPEKKLVPGRRPFSGKCGAGHKNLPALWSGRQQQSGDTGEKIGTADPGIYRKSERIRTWEKEDMEFLEDSIYRKL